MIKTKQELLNHFSDINTMYNNPFMYQTLSNMIDELLEQQPCKDSISREAVLEYIDKMPSELTSDGRRMVIRRTLEEYISDTLPSVTPKFTDEEIQKIQELEQAQLEKAYELGMQISFEEWLSSFNTDSATECFTAVQELKKKLEGEG